MSGWSIVFRALFLWLIGACAAASWALDKADIAGAWVLNVAWFGSVIQFVVEVEMAGIEPAPGASAEKEGT